MKFSIDNMGNLMKMLKDEVPEAFESYTFDSAKDEPSEDDTEMTKFFRALSV